MAFSQVLLAELLDVNDIWAIDIPILPAQAIKFFLKIFGAWPRQDLKTHVLLDQLATLANLNGRLLLVTGQDPDLDVRFNQHINGLRDSVLQFVFNGRGTTIDKISFVGVVQGCQLLLFHNQSSIRCFDLVDLIIELVIFLLVHFFLAYDERTEAFLGKTEQLSLNVHELLLVFIFFGEAR